MSAAEGPRRTAGGRSRIAGDGGRPGRVVLLGPGPSSEDLQRVLEDVATEGAVATIRAGWQEWESEPGALAGALGDREVPLELHARAERAWREDPDLMAAHRAMQQDVRLLRRAYNVRLSAAMGAVTELGRLDDPAGVTGAEREAVLETIRDLDAHQLRRIAEVRAEFAASTGLARRPVIARERADIADRLHGAFTVVVDGGHVAVLLNRIRLLGLDTLLGGRTIIGISGGAMVLTDRLVLFHDSPPWGPGHAEVAETGLRLAPGIVALPHAADRLRLDDPVRVGRLARRLAPAECVVLGEGARLDWDGDRWSGHGAPRLTIDGAVVSGRGAAA